MFHELQIFDDSFQIAFFAVALVAPLYSSDLVLKRNPYRGFELEKYLFFGDVLNAVVLVYGPGQADSVA